MCTVTFLPLGKSNFILTSNRDEQKERATLFPKKYIEDNVELVFPKDKLAGGTWIGVSSKKRLVCVLNGAFENHKKKNSYKKSRGLIAKEILKGEDFTTYIEDLDLEGIEPFTIVIVDWNASLNLYELIWDEQQKRFSKLKNEPKIWSSSTLYSNEIKELRKKWFKDWVESHEFSSETILAFHSSEIGDKAQSILMKRPTVETVSITLVKKEGAIVKMNYNDVVHSKSTTLLV
ncbi:Transport and Golgi organisation 2 [Lutibacter agarilyticus]|uniref:Transport and Golgi organisation 2 n=1 Tax=Lutibacter agarilyticus TaxID=1109740 RepID=A0A238X9F9_9FLAO|nr:NRDE family protein [Lutibacter agarilyticus]SNR55685.1 Transport and Golgi organisation 2 [Lutibacter agarilyticus]